MSKKAAPKPPSKPRSVGPREDMVTRISKTNHERIRRLTTLTTDKKAPSLNEALERLLDAQEAVLKSETLYLFGGQVYLDPAEARGEAVMYSARVKAEAVVWPSIAIVIGRDEP